MPIYADRSGSIAALNIGNGESGLFFAAAKGNFLKSMRFTLASDSARVRLPSERNLLIIFVAQPWFLLQSGLLQTFFLQPEPAWEDVSIYTGPQEVCTVCGGVVPGVVKNGFAEAIAVGGIYSRFMAASEPLVAI